MAGLPPPPNQAEPGSRLWNDWFTKLQNVLSSVNGVSWALIDKAGSNLSDLATRTHAMLTAVQGTGSNHISAAENTTVTSLSSRGIVDVKTMAGVPTTTDIPAGQWAIYKDSSGGTLKLYANDGGVLKSVALV